MLIKQSTRFLVFSLACGAALVGQFLGIIHVDDVGRAVTGLGWLTSYAAAVILREMGK